MKPLALLLLLPGFALCVSAAEIIAHRGASRDAPENTLAAFKLGWQLQADGVELDLRLTKDGQIICLHDENTKRTTGVAKSAATSTLAELRKLDAGSWKAPKWKGEKLPTLTEALAAIPAGKRLVMEIKCGSEILPALARDLKASEKPAAQLVIISFDYDVCGRAKRLFPQIPVLLLSGFNRDGRTGAWSPAPAELIRKARAAGLDGLNLSVQGPLDADWVKQIHAAGLKIFVWTVNDAKTARKLVAAGVDGITTDRPAWLRGQLR